MNAKHLAFIVTKKATYGSAPQGASSQPDQHADAANNAQRQANGGNPWVLAMRQNGYDQQWREICNQKRKYPFKGPG